MLGRSTNCQPANPKAPIAATAPPASRYLTARAAFGKPTGSIYSPCFIGRLPIGESRYAPDDTLPCGRIFLAVAFVQIDAMNLIERHGKAHVIQPHLHQSIDFTATVGFGSDPLR